MKTLPKQYEVCGTCVNSRRDDFRDKTYCVFDEKDYYQGRKTNEVKKHWQEACSEYKPACKILVTPVASSGIAPFEVCGQTLTSKHFDDCGTIYYIAGRSFMAEIVTILEGKVTAHA